MPKPSQFLQEPTIGPPFPLPHPILWFYLLRIWPSFVHSAFPNKGVTLLFHNTPKEAFISESLQWLVTLLGMFFFQIFLWLTPCLVLTSFKSLLKCHFLNEAFPNNSIQNHICTPPTLASSPWLAYLSSIILCNLLIYCGHWLFPPLECKLCESRDFCLVCLLIYKQYLEQ